MILGNYINIGRRRGGEWSPTGDTSLLAKVLYWGAVSDISGGQMPNKITGATDYLTVSGSPATYQAPDAAAYKSADTDKIWFTAADAQRTTTTAELIGYDFSRTLIKYDNTTPYAIREIIILKVGEVLTATEENNLRDYMQLSVWWSGVLSAHGNTKGNRYGYREIFIVPFLDHFTGTVINTNRWTETDPNSIISQNNQLILTLAHAGTISAFTNKLTSTYAIPSAVAILQAYLTWTTDTAASAIGALYLYKDAQNYAGVISRATTPGNYRLSIMTGGVSRYDFSTAITKAKDVKIWTDGTTIKFYYWNGSAWVQMGTTQTFSLGYSLYCVITGTDAAIWTGANPVNIDDLYMETTEYATHYPNSY